MVQCRSARKFIDHVHYYALVLPEFANCRDHDAGPGLSRCLTS